MTSFVTGSHVAVELRHRKFARVVAWGNADRVSVWRVDGTQAVPVERSALANEKQLEDILAVDIGLLGLPNQLLVVGRQVVTDYAGRVDLLCVDQDGSLYT